jgi:hypothetical protein
MSLRRLRRKEYSVVADHDLRSPLATLNRASRITLYLPLCGSNVFGKRDFLATFGWKVRTFFCIGTFLNLREG